MKYVLIGFVSLAAVAAVWFGGIAADVLVIAIKQQTASLVYPVLKGGYCLETSRVRATCYENDNIGYNIGFDFPEDTDNADRAEVGDFMEAHQGRILLGAVRPGATIYVKFKDVTDHESAIAKLRDILPSLSQLMADMAISKTIKIAKPKPEYKWPDTAPPDKDYPINGIFVDGVPYKKEEVSPGRWQWVVDYRARLRAKYAPA